ncbi:unnamed protein product [Notodromas monacha]|uniref:Major facilitator superfamily (MFS) profile domain-containing protein n=1 Tax=Notodromas monacha TaxID=399045 RepID=A0A7R9BYX9_9CRUS|nr:unnamed protein product [Notodromas monacha]CAG0922893.1 unnamed protein product [Notodromas monacha]
MKGTDKFAWDESTQSWILSSVFIGYITTQLLGGRLAERFGGKLVLGVPMLLAGLLSLLTPVAAKKLGSTAVMVPRVLIGMAEGVTFPAMHVILSNWAPPLERSRMVTMVYADSPENHPYISTEEKLFILATLSKEKKTFYFAFETSGSSAGEANSFLLASLSRTSTTSPQEDVSNQATIAASYHQQTRGFRHNPFRFDSQTFR